MIHPHPGIPLIKQRKTMNISKYMDLFLFFKYELILTKSTYFRKILIINRKGKILGKYINKNVLVVVLICSLINWEKLINKKQLIINSIDNRKYFFIVNIIQQNNFLL